MKLKLEVAHDEELEDGSTKVVSFITIIIITIILIIESKTTSQSGSSSFLEVRRLQWTGWTCSQNGRR